MSSECLVFSKINWWNHDEPFKRRLCRRLGHSSHFAFVALISSSQHFLRPTKLNYCKMCRAIRLLTLLACFLVASSNPIEPTDDQIFFLNLDSSGKCSTEFLSFDWSLIAAYSIRLNGWVTSKLNGAHSFAVHYRTIGFDGNDRRRSRPSCGTEEYSRILDDDRNRYEDPRDRHSTHAEPRFW